MKAVCISTKAIDENKPQVINEVITYEQSEIARLVDEAADGDFEAFGELYSIYLDRIYRYVFYQVKDRMTAEDITEEVFIKAWKAINSCKGRGKTFLSWLYRIAHNHLVNTLQRIKKHASIEMQTLIEVDNFEPEAEATLVNEELSGMIACLPQNQRQVIMLKFIEGLDNREIGQVMGKKEGAIRVLQMRALSKLRQKLSKEVIRK